MSYAKQLTSITGVKDGFLSCLTCCNRKVYALATDSDHVVQVGITVTKGRQVAIKLFLFSKFGGASLNGCSAGIQYLEGSCTELFSLLIGFKDKDDTMETIHAVRLFKLDMTNRIWEELDDLKDTLFSVDFTSKYSVLYSPAITTSSELGAGGYIHILRVKGNIVYSYHVKDKTISVSCMPACLVGTSHVSAWAMPVNTLVRPRTSEEYQVKDKEDDDDDDIAIMEDAEESQLLLSIPFDVLKIIMEFCVGVEYLKFRATCKQCRLAAPPLMIQWSKETASKFVNSPWPWLMVFDQHQGEGVITFTDPLFGDRYFIKTPRELVCDLRIFYCKYGWLLMFKGVGPTVFFNPFTGEIIEVPIPHLTSFCFSAPPTSPDCMVVGFTSCNHLGWSGFVHCAADWVVRPHDWRTLRLNFNGDDPYSFSFPTLYGPDLYVLSNNQTLDAFRDIRQEDYSWENGIDYVPTPTPTPTPGCKSSGPQYFLVKYDDSLLLIIVGTFGEYVEVYKSDDDKEKWEKIDGLGRNMVYISDTTCLCLEAKIPEMENKIYFPRLHPNNGKIVFYSLETCRYHTFHGKNIQENDNLGDFFGTKHYLAPHAWIEPSCS